MCRAVADGLSPLPSPIRSFPELDPKREGWRIAAALACRHTFIMKTRIKVCCIASTEEASMAIGAGADALGLVARMPSGPGPIPDAKNR